MMRSVQIISPVLFSRAERVLTCSRACSEGSMRPERARVRTHARMCILLSFILCYCVRYCCVLTHAYVLSVSLWNALCTACSQRPTQSAKTSALDCLTTTTTKMTSRMQKISLTAEQTTRQESSLRGQTTAHTCCTWLNEHEFTRVATYVD